MLSSHLEILGSIVSAMQDDSSELRRRALSSLKIAAKDNAEQLLIRTSPQIGSDSVDSTLGRRIILIIQTLGAASGDVGTAEYIHIKQADKDCVLSGIRKMLRRIGASR
nr:potassium transporter 7-like isoform X1 [Ipomoea batatas]